MRDFLLRKKFVWIETAQKSINYLKRAICEKKNNYLDKKLKTEVVIDASTSDLGAVMLQYVPRTSVNRLDQQQISMKIFVNDILLI